MLSETDIRQRLIRLSNLERLYAKARERIAFLEAENKQLKERIKELEQRDSDKNTRIEALAFQLEQIQTRVFGKKPTALRIALTRERKERDGASERPLEQPSLRVAGRDGETSLRCCLLHTHATPRRSQKSRNRCAKTKKNTLLSSNTRVFP